MPRSRVSTEPQTRGRGGQDQAHDEEEDDPEEHREDEPPSDGGHPPVVRKLVGDDRDDHEVVGAERDLDEGDPEEAGPGGGVEEKGGHGVVA